MEVPDRFHLQVEVGETVAFVHKPTGLLVSTTGILNGQDEGWLEVENDDNDNVNDRKKTMTIDLPLESSTGKM